MQQRTNEIGLRMALGASPRDGSLRLILGEGLALAAIGIVHRASSARRSPARGDRRMLFGVGPFDPVSFGGIAALLLAVAALACAFPAWRAMRIDPLTALRQE